jgi:hypothetical protein
MSLDQYSQTPASNDLPGYGNTGMRPSLVKNAFWDVMADSAQQFLGLPTSGGTANAQTITNTRQIAALVTGYGQWFIAGNTTTAAFTVAIDGTAAKSVFFNGAAATLGVIAGQAYYIKFDGTNYNISFISRVTGSFTGQGVGWAATAPSATMNYVILPDGTTIYTYLPQFTGVSNSASTSITGMPASIQPTTGFARENYIVDSGSVGPGSISIAAGTNTILFGKGSNYGTGGFTTTGAKTVGASVSTSIQLTWQRSP